MFVCVFNQIHSPCSVAKMSIDPRKVGAGMVLLVLLLIMALAYNMGGSAQENRDLPLIGVTNSRIVSTSRRLSQCRDKVARLQDGQRRHAEEVAQEVQDSIDSLTSDSAALEQHVADLKLRVDTCQGTKEREQSEFDDGPENNVDDRIRSLNVEIAAANQTLDAVVATRVGDDQDMLRVLLALRRANAAMEEKIRAEAPPTTTTAAAATTTATTAAADTTTGGPAAAATTAAAAAAAAATTTDSATTTGAAASAATTSAATTTAAPSA
jgi:hypothetical protein